MLSHHDVLDETLIANVIRITSIFIPCSFHRVPPMFYFLIDDARRSVVLLAVVPVFTMV